MVTMRATLASVPDVAFTTVAPARSVPVATVPA